MSRATWNRIKQSKFFYVRNYRVMTFFVVISTGLNAVLCLAIFYAYLNRPLITFYATSGVALPVELRALSAPNYSSEALLAPDPVEEDAKSIPE